MSVHSDFWILLFLCFTISSCLPSPPPSDYFASATVTPDGIQVFNAKHSPRGKNLVLVIADSYIQGALSRQFHSAYPSLPENISLEQLTWWKLYGSLSSNYDQIELVTGQSVHYSSLMESIQRAEAVKKPFDLIFLTHGYPNHISTGQGYFLSYQEIDALKDRLPHLNLVFMQGCYSTSLARDWQEAGAHYVLSFLSENRNFFYIALFLNLYSTDVKVAHERTVAGLYSYLRDSSLYTDVIQLLGMSVDQYMAASEEPILFITDDSAINGLTVQPRCAGITDPNKLDDCYAQH